MSKQFEIRPYQQRAVEFICDLPKSALHIGMGLGKTLSTLIALHKQRDSYKKALIVAPPKVAYGTWVEAIEQANGWGLCDFTYTTIKSTDHIKKRLEALQSNAKLFICNYEMLTFIKNHNFQHHFDFIVLDESTFVKNFQSVRFKLLKKDFTYSRMVQLTAMAIPNGYEDLWSQIYLLDKGERLGINITQYRDRYFAKQSFRNFSTYKCTAPNIIQQKISDIVYVLRSEDYLELPEKIIDYTYIDFDDRSLFTKYKYFHKHRVLSFINGENITAFNKAVLVGKLLQFCNGAIYTEHGETEYIHNYKIDALRQLIEQYGDENIIVMYNFRSDLERLKVAFPNAVVYKTEEDKKAWDTGKIKMLLCHPVTCSRGLNLQYGGRIMVWFSLTYDYETYTQANGRLHRYGQDKPVVINHLIMRDTHESKVLETLQEKGYTQEEFLKALTKKIT